MSLGESPKILGHRGSEPPPGNFSAKGGPQRRATVISRTPRLRETATCYAPFGHREGAATQVHITSAGMRFARSLSPRSAAYR